MDFVVHKSKITMCSGQSLSASFTTASVDIQSYSLYALQFSWSGYSTGSVTVETQGSNDDTTFTTIDSFIISTNPTSYILNVEKAGYSNVRVKVTSSSGTGTLTAIINGKVL